MSSTAMPVPKTFTAEFSIPYYWRRSIVVVDNINTDLAFAESLPSPMRKSKIVNLRRSFLDETKIRERKAGHRIQQILCDSYIHRDALGHNL